MGIRKADTWWNEPASTVGAKVSALVDMLWKEDARRRDEVESNMRLYSGRNFMGSTPQTYGRNLAVGRGKEVKLNLTKSAVDTITAKVGKNRPRPTFLTDGGDFGLQQRAKKLQQFMDGIFQQAKVYAKTPIGFRDAMLAGTGVWYFYTEDDRPCVERVFPLEVLVDPVEAINGEPLSLYRVRFISPDKLIEVFPKHRNEILDIQPVDRDDADSAMYGESQGGSPAPRLVRVVEAWHLKVGKKCGRYVVAAGQCTLDDKEWDYDYFPFEFLHWCAPVRGFWGDSAVSEIRGLHIEVNKLLQVTQRSMSLTANPWTLVPLGSKLKFGKVTNEPGVKVEYDGGVPPTVVVHQSIHQQVLDHMWNMHDRALNNLGSNELAASGTKPAGIESGRALEQLSEEHLVRFETVSHAMEDCVGARFPRQFLRLAKELDDTLEGGYQVKAIKNRTTLKLKFSEVYISPDDFFVQVFPTSSLSNSPSGRLEEVERLVQGQYIDQATGRKLLNFPDLRGVMDVTSADAELLEYHLDAMLSEGKPCEPDPHQDLQRVLRYGSLAYLKSEYDGTPESHRELLRNYLDAAAELLPPPEPAQNTVVSPGAGAPDGGGVPPGMPG